MPYEYEVSDVIPAGPEEIYDAWLDSASHTAMTGSKATASARAGAEFTAWDGYIWGKNLVLEPGRRIVQSWRTTEFTEDQQDSQIEVTFVAVRAGTKVTLRHTNVPDEQTGYENGGWQDNYFEPMKRYFSSRGRGGAKKSKEAGKSKGAGKNKSARKRRGAGRSTTKRTGGSRRTG